MQYFEFKLVRSMVLLFLFQCVGSLLCVLYLYLLTDILHLLPISIGHSNMGVAGSIIGSLFFGMRTEKKYPGLLSKERIKKLALWFSLAVLMVLALITFLYLLYSQHDDLIRTVVISLLWLGGIAICYMPISYFTIILFVSRGIKISQLKKDVLV